MTICEFTSVEKPIIQALTSPALGWTYEPGDQVTAHYRNGDEQEMLLLPILRRKLRELNPTVITSDERADRILTTLRGLRDNQEWLRWLRNEKTHQFAPDEKSQTIRLVAYDDPDANDFLATNQLWIQGVERRRPDILLFLNGVPIVDIEAKTAARGRIDWAQGAKQTGRYDAEIPNLYYSNCFCVGVNELRMLYGVPGARLQFWQQWRDPAPHTQIPAADEMNCTLYGLFDRGNLLDLIQNYLLFDTEEGRTVKKVARYQQFRAANEIVARALELKQPAKWRRGIVWHTQGSGKSLTMIFAARKLWNHPALTQPTIVIVVDRLQLLDQMLGNLFGTNTENVTEAHTIADLARLIRAEHRGIILTTVNRFEGMQARLSSRQNIILLADEAHRSQEGDLGIFMRSALPNASLFGFTGTPIELDDHNTPRAFGREVAPDRFERYMDRYSITDSIRDRQTVPIRYEVRMTDWTVASADLDVKFEEIFADRSPEERAHLQHEARLDAILKHPRRIAQVSQDVADHFVQHVRPNAFKAMVVCRDKEACALYKSALDSLLAPEVSLVVVSQDPVRDPPALQAHYLSDADRRQALDDFKKPAPQDQDERDDPGNRFRRVEILIVCDMLLTGFDAPILQVMYLDKGMRDHTLLQAIARVNRPHTELKEHGLIFDYFGIFEDLNAALNYDRAELGDVAFPFRRLREMFGEQIARLSAIFAGIDRGGSHPSLIRAMGLLSDDTAQQQHFEKLFRDVRILFESLQPDEFLQSHLDEYEWLCKLFMLYRKKFYPLEHFEITEEDGAKTRQLIREHVDVQALQTDFPSYTLDADYLTKIESMNPDEKAIDIEGQLDAELRIRLSEDEDARPLSERLNRIIEQKRAGTLAGIALLRELEELTKQVVEISEESRRPVADSIAAEVRKRCPDLAAETIAQVVDGIVARAGELCFAGWLNQAEMDKELFREFTILLATDYTDLGLHGQDQDFVDRCIRLLKKARFSADPPG
jgi:type I restriction enzyme R subunit